jgi:hypothetical protein
MLALYNTPFYSFRFPLSNHSGIFLFELMVPHFRDQNYDVSSWKNEHFRHLRPYEFNRGSKVAEAPWDICTVCGEDSIAKRTAQKWVTPFNQGNFYMSDTPRSGRHLVGCRGGCPLWTAWEEPDLHCWTLLSTTSPPGGSNLAKTSG